MQSMTDSASELSFWKMWASKMSGTIAAAKIKTIHELWCSTELGALLEPMIVQW